MVKLLPSILEKKSQLQIQVFSQFLPSSPSLWPGTDLFSFVTSWELLPKVFSLIFFLTHTHKDQEVEMGKALKLGIAN